MASLTRDGVAAIHVLHLGSRKNTVSLNLHEAYDADFSTGVRDSRGRRTQHFKSIGQSF